MTTRKKSIPKSFKAAYQILKTNAENLQNSDEPDIDNLMKTVEQSIDAYKVCQARIEAVQRALDAAFEEDTDDAIEDKRVAEEMVAEKAIEAVEEDLTTTDTVKEATMQANTVTEDYSTKAPLEEDSVRQDDEED